VGYDAGKKVKGRKIHALVDTEGLPMRVVVHSAAIPDRDGAGLVIDKIHRHFPWLELIWADGGYNAWRVEAAAAKMPVSRMEIVRRSDDTNDQDCATCGRWDGPKLTGQIDPTWALRVRAWNGS
jgi:transposase